MSNIAMRKRKAISFIISYLIIMAASALISFCFMEDVIEWKVQVELIKMVREISTFLFGVMGVWIGIIYPKSLKDIFKLERETPSNLKDLKSIFFPIRNATLILLITITMQWMHPLIKSLDFVKTNRDLLLNFNFFIITSCVFILCWSLILTLIPLDNSEANIENAERTRSAINNLTDGR